MTIPRLTVDDTLLLVIDVQERLMPTIDDREQLKNNCAVLLRVAGLLGVPAAVTEQYPRGLGTTVPEVAEAIAPNTPVLEKTRFSALTTEVNAVLEAEHRNTILVCGIEAHICVLQTVLDLRATGHDVFFATDAISAGQPDQIPHAYRRMEAAGAVPTGCLSALYELMGDKENPVFGPALALAKAVRSPA